MCEAGKQISTKVTEGKSREQEKQANITKKGCLGTGAIQKKKSVGVWFPFLDMGGGSGKIFGPFTKKLAFFNLVRI